MGRMPLPSQGSGTQFRAASSLQGESWEIVGKVRALRTRRPPRPCRLGLATPLCALHASSPPLMWHLLQIASAAVPLAVAAGVAIGLFAAGTYNEGATVFLDT